MGELDQRLALHVERAHGLPPDSSVTVALAEPVAGSITFFEVAPLAGALRSMITRSRPLRPTDVVPATNAKSGSDDVRADRNRPADVLDLMDTLSADLAAELAAVQGVTDRDAQGSPAVDDHIVATVDLLGEVGRFAVPNSGWGDIDQRRGRPRSAWCVTLHGEVVDRWSDAARVRRRAARSRRCAADDGQRRGAHPDAAARRARGSRLRPRLPCPRMPTHIASRSMDCARSSPRSSRRSARCSGQPTLHDAIDAADAALPLEPSTTRRSTWTTSTKRWSSCSSTSLRDWLAASAGGRSTPCGCRAVCLRRTTRRPPGRRAWKR